MKKLIKYFNKYKGDKIRGKFDFDRKSNVFFRGEYDDYEEIKECEIISKKFGFIKWLCDNDKIDYENDILFGMNIYQNGNQLFLKSEDEIIMQLSISDTAIEDLISLLN